MVLLYSPHTPAKNKTKNKTTHGFDRGPFLKYEEGGPARAHLKTIVTSFANSLASVL